MDGVSAEVPEKVRVLLKNGDFDSGASQKQA